ncbi:MAG: serpin family protein, partial [Gaiellales bacterium]
VPDDLAAFERALSPESLSLVISALGSRSVDLTLPRFGLETSAELASILAAMGMPNAFDPNGADFSGMTTAEQLYISVVIHQANIDVDEKGTEAAAATAVAMRASAEPGGPVTLRVDHPFIFLLRDVPTGAIVFMGRVVDPSVKG